MKPEDAKRFTERSEQIDKKLNKLFDDVDSTIKDLSGMYEEMFDDIEKTLKEYEGKNSYSFTTKDGVITEVTITSGGSGGGWGDKSPPEFPPNEDVPFYPYSLRKTWKDIRRWWSF